MSPHPRYLFILLVSIVLAACGNGEPPKPLPQPVVVESPQPLAVGASDAYAGQVRARIEADLSFRVPGKIVERRIEMGARVSPGTVLAVLDPQDARLNLEAAKASVAAAEADLWLAREEEKRYRDLKAKGYVGQSPLDVRSGTTKLAQARLEQARAQFDLARNQSRYTELKADAAGVVTQVMAEVSNVVSAGQPVAHFAADGEREVRIQVPEGRAQALETASKIEISLYSEPDKRYAARIREVNPQADPATRTHEVRVTILEPDAAVQLGATATVYVGGDGNGKSFRLPATGLGSIGKNQPAVWRLEIGDNGVISAQPVPVQVLQYLDDAVIVIGELNEDDRLISAGVHRLVPGMAVQPIDRTAKAAL
ncbi:MAG: efflux RND transporter periplasmic adaptor subunit [Gammaproteobacteria bacterium]